MGLAPAGWLVRNFLSDGEMFQRVKQENTSEVMRAYLRSRASRHRAEVQQMIYPKAFAEARKKGTVTAYRTMLVDYPTSPFAEEARKEVHAVFVASLEKFKVRASGGDPESTPKVVAFFEQLIEYLEKQPTAQIAVYFRSPLTAPLAELDKTLAQKDVAPVAPHFTAESSRSRESAMVAAMQQGFSAIFPGDVLSLSHQLTPPSDARQNGLRTASTCRAGSQNPIDRPMVGFTPQLQTGLDGFGMSSCPSKLAIVALPMLIGRMQLQQISVIGLGKRPVQVRLSAACAGATQGRATASNARASTWLAHRRSAGILGAASQRIREGRVVIARAPRRRAGACLPARPGRAPA